MRDPEGVPRSVAEATFEVRNRLGLHARAASKLVQTINRFVSHVRLYKDDVEVDGKSIMGVLMLAAANGTFVRIVAEGTDCEAVLKAVEALFLQKFGEE